MIAHPFVNLAEHEIDVVNSGEIRVDIDDLLQAVENRFVVARDALFVVLIRFAFVKIELGGFQALGRGFLHFGIARHGDRSASRALLKGKADNVRSNKRKNQDKSKIHSIFHKYPPQDLNHEETKKMKFF